MWVVVASQMDMNETMHESSSRFPFRHFDFGAWPPALLFLAILIPSYLHTYLLSWCLVSRDWVLCHPATHGFFLSDYF